MSSVMIGWNSPHQSPGKVAGHICDALFFSALPGSEITTTTGVYLRHEPRVDPCVLDGWKNLHASHFM